MRLFVAGILLLTSTIVGAQNFIGLKSGLNISNVATDIDFKPDWRFRYSGGATFEHFFNSTWSVEVDLLYSQRGYKSHIQISQGPNGPSDLYTAWTAFNYLTLPVKASVYLGTKKVFFISAGVVPGVYTDGNVRSDYPPQKGKVKIDSDMMSKFDLSLQFETGVCYPITDKYSVYGSLAFLKGMTSLSPDGYGFKNLVGAISAGVKMKVGSI
jgi:hypothetical protein